jgi:CheY-like chemotaxis protein
VSRSRVVVLADDLIWSTRIVSILTRIGAAPVTAKTAPELDRALACADRAIVDLTASNYDPVAAIERVAKRGLPVLAVGQHEDLALRKRALAAGAERVYAYRKIFEDGPATLGRWIGPEAAEATA